MLRDSGSEMRTFREDVLAGLRRTRKEIPCKYLYDDRGSQLFERICELEEYYPTRTELRIMQEHAEEMAEACGEKVLLVEYGSGSSLKTRVLLERLHHPAGYVPIDISRGPLRRSARTLARAFPDLEVLPVCADYTGPYEIPTLRRPAARRVVYFPGSTIGNFSHAESALFLKHMARTCGSGGGLLIGVDLVKEREILERAYDDAQGVTSAFICNVFVRINRELRADFRLDRLEYYAEYQESFDRVEMGVISVEDHVVQVAGETFRLAKGESIHVENSHKYTLERFAELAAQADLAVRRVWTDPDRLFSVQYLTPV